MDIHALVHSWEVWVFTTFVATKIVESIWKQIGDFKTITTAKANEDIDAITKRWPLIGLVIHECITQAKKLYGQDDIDSIVLWAATEAKKRIPGWVDDVIIDMLVKKYVDQRNLQKQAQAIPADVPAAPQP